MTSDEVTVAVAQIDSAFGDLEANHEIHLRMIERARGAGIGLLVFPELSLSGYDLKERLRELAIDRDHALLGSLADAAGDMVIAVGFPERNGGNKPFNSLAFLKAGHVIGVHRKIYLPHHGRLEEKNWFVAADEFQLIDIGGWRVAPMICADIWDPAVVYAMMLEGADLVVCSANSSIAGACDEFSNREGWPMATRHVAMLYGLPVVFANRTGRENGFKYWGESTIYDAGGAIAARAGDGSDELISARLTRDRIDVARESLQTLAQTRTDILTTHLAGGAGERRKAG